MMPTENYQENDVLSIITLSVGIVSGVLVLLLGAFAGMIGILGVILANVAKRQERFNHTFIRVGEIISWITTGLFILLMFISMV